MLLGSRGCAQLLIRGASYPHQISGPKFPAAIPRILGITSLAICIVHTQLATIFYHLNQLYS